MDYIKGLIAIRKAHGAFRFSSAQLIRKHIQADYSLPGTVTLHFKDVEAYGPWNEIFVIFHASEDTAAVSLPEGEGGWKVLSDGNKAGLEPLETLTGKVMEASPISCYVCCR